MRLCVAGLRQILTDVIEEVRQSVNQDIDGAEILHSLLNAPWLQSLLKVSKRSELSLQCGYEQNINFINYFDMMSAPKVQRETLFLCVFTTELQGRWVTYCISVRYTHACTVQSRTSYSYFPNKISERNNEVDPIRDKRLISSFSKILKCPLSFTL